VEPVPEPVKLKPHEVTAAQVKATLEAQMNAVTQLLTARAERPLLVSRWFAQLLNQCVVEMPKYDQSKFTFGAIRLLFCCEKLSTFFFFFCTAAPRA
jgi:hypothetical protein